MDNHWGAGMIILILHTKGETKASLKTRIMFLLIFTTPLRYIYSSFHKRANGRTEIGSQEYPSSRHWQTGFKTHPCLIPQPVSIMTQSPAMMFMLGMIFYWYVCSLDVKYHDYMTVKGSFSSLLKTQLRCEVKDCFILKVQNTLVFILESLPVNHWSSVLEVTVPLIVIRLYVENKLNVEPRLKKSIIF